MARLAILLPIAALIFLGFVGGAVVMRFELPPYEYLRQAFLAAEAVVSSQTRQTPIADLHIGAKVLHPEDFENPGTRETREGVVTHDEELAWNGYTIYTTLKLHTKIPLVDMDGKVLHVWTLPEDDLRGPRDDGLQLPENPLAVTHPRLLPNGDMILVVNTVWQTPWGFGVVKVDKDSNVIWTYLKKAHHDVDIGPDGEVYVHTHSIINEPWPGLDRIETPFVEDTIAILSPDGEEQKTISVLKAIQDSPWASLLMYADPANPRGDLLHTNSVKYIDAAKAQAMGVAQEGQLLVSLRNLDVILIIDPRTEQVTWAARGPWRMQHDPDILPNGNLLIFDNRGDLRRGGRSRVIEVNPRTLGVVWQWPTDPDEPFYTSVYGSQQPLPNGNVLISETNNGRIIEVSPAGDIVWDFYVPRIINQKGEDRSQAKWATRFVPDSLDFEFNYGETGR